MNSAALGRNTSPVEVTNVSVHGFWLFVGEREHFVDVSRVSLVPRRSNRGHHQRRVAEPSAPLLA